MNVHYFCHSIILSAMSLVRFRNPCSLACYGASQTGKTSFVKKLLMNRDEMFEHKIHKILYCYTTYQKAFEEMEKIDNLEFKKGMPGPQDIEKLTESGLHTILVLDDLMSVINNSNFAEEIFVCSSHHLCMTTIFLSQNLFQGGKKARTISLQLHYLILFRNLRDQSQISTLGRQLYPGKKKEFQAVYNDALKEPYSYLVVDTSPHSDRRYQLRKNIFPQEYPIIYQLD